LDTLQINWLAVVAASVAMFVLGGLWYSPMLFYKGWLSATKLTETELKGRNMPLVFGMAFVLTFLMAVCLAFFLADQKTDLAWGITAGLLAGLGWATFSFAIIALFEKRTLSYVLINGGYITVGFVLMGAILGGWR